MANKEGNYGAWAESGKAEVKTQDQKDMEMAAEQVEPKEISLDQILSGIKSDSPKEASGADEARKQLAAEEAKLELEAKGDVTDAEIDSAFEGARVIEK